MSEITVSPIAPEAAGRFKASIEGGRPASAEADDEAHLLGALRDTALVGFAAFVREDRPGVGFEGCHRLRELLVAPAHRRQGIGARLVEACAEAARAKGGTELWAYVPPAVAGFFTQQGFDTEGPPEPLGSLGPHFLMRLYLG